jgi:hypothetical protein
MHFPNHILQCFTFETIEQGERVHRHATGSPVGEQIHFSCERPTRLFINTTAYLLIEWPFRRQKIVTVEAEQVGLLDTYPGTYIRDMSNVFNIREQAHMGVFEKVFGRKNSMVT